MEDINQKDIEIENSIESIKPEVSFDDFMKIDIRLCQILSVEKVEKTDKLYKLEIFTGIDKRIVVSAIAHKFSPEDLLDKTLPFVLNLPVRKIAGIPSYGMIILAEDKTNNILYQLLTPNGSGEGSIVI
jgi:methionyl-tRNA synthetase